MSRVVLDASAAVRTVLRAPGSDRLVDALDRAVLVLVPSLFFSEVANALWKYTAADDGLSAAECTEHLSEVDSLIDEIFDDRELVVEALHQAAAHGHPVYDLLYAVLARRTGATVLTCDRRLSALLESMGIAHEAVEPA